MKQWIKKHRVKIWISSILILCISIGGYLWIRNKQITEAKQEIQYSNHLLSEFHRQKTLYQKVEFLIHTLPDTNNESPFCYYDYPIDYPDNGWREAKPDTIDVATTTNDKKFKNYQVIFLSPVDKNESIEGENLCVIDIVNINTDTKYRFFVDNNWNIIKCYSTGYKKIPQIKQDKLLQIGKKGTEFLFNTINRELENYRKDAYKVLQKYNVSY